MPENENQGNVTIHNVSWPSPDTINIEVYNELPDSVCWKVDVDELEVQQLVAYMKELMGNPAVRKQLVRDTAFFAENCCLHELTVKLYVDVVNRIKSG